jgi:hypothetical protein
MLLGTGAAHWRHQRRPLPCYLVAPGSPVCPYLGTGETYAVLALVAAFIAVALRELIPEGWPFRSALMHRQPAQYPRVIHAGGTTFFAVDHAVARTRVQHSHARAFQLLKGDRTRAFEVLAPAFWARSSFTGPGLSAAIGIYGGRARYSATILRY